MVADVGDRVQESPVSTIRPNARALDAINAAQVLVSRVVEYHAAKVPHLELIGLLDKASMNVEACLVAAHADGADMGHILPRKRHMEGLIRAVRGALDKGGFRSRDGLYGLLNDQMMKSPDYLDAVRGIWA